MASPARVQTLDIDGQVLRVGVRAGTGTPLLLFNGIGANMALLDPVVDALDGLETIVFDVPGVGSSYECCHATPRGDESLRPCTAR
jgi:pimeloyl-ACP methyl ester carboxylesterase